MKILLGIVFTATVTLAIHNEMQRQRQEAAAASLVEHAEILAILQPESVAPTKDLRSQKVWSRSLDGSWIEHDVNSASMQAVGGSGGSDGARKAQVSEAHRQAAPKLKGTSLDEPAHAAH